MTIKPALLIVWPSHVDFPLFRYNLNRFKDFFHSVNIGFTNHHMEHNYSNFVRESLPFAHFIEVTRGGGDWRDEAVNALLDSIDAEHILFMEQDFLMENETIFQKVFEQEGGFYYYKERDRIHPAFALVSMEMIKKTGRDFAPLPPGDHFVTFFGQLGDGVNLEALGLELRKDYYHMQGVSQNYNSFLYDEAFFSPANFLYYNYKSMLLPNQHPHFLSLQQQIERQFGHPKRHMFLDRFFP